MIAGRLNGSVFTGRRRMWLAGVATVTAVPLVILPSGQRAGAAALPAGCARTGGTTVACTYTADHAFTVPVVVDSEFGTVRCREQVLEPGHTTACESRTHVTTEADVERGEVSNTAYARAHDGNGDADGTGDVDSAPVTVTVELARPPVAPVTG